MKKINIKFELQSPLSHFGDERLGTMQVARTNKFKVDDEFIDIPVYSGNAFRGLFRRIAMRDFLERLDLAEEGISEKLYYALFTGGSLVGGSRYEEVGDNLELQRMCVPLALLGSALGDKIVQGKMKSSIFIPACKETVDYTGIDSEISFYDMLEDIFYTRKDDLKSVSVNVVRDEKKKENPTQMKYDAQCLSAGTVLVGDVVLEHANEIEESFFNAVMKQLEQVPYIGGKSSAGHGKVKIEYTELQDENIYYNYLEENKEQIREYMRKMEEALK